MISDGATEAVMAQAIRALRSPVASLGHEIKALDQVEKAVAIAKAEKLAEMEATLAHEAEGASSITVWARREIGQDAYVTRAQVKATASASLPEHTSSSASRDASGADCVGHGLS